MIVENDCSAYWKSWDDDRRHSKNTSPKTTRFFVFIYAQCLLIWF